MTGGGGGLGLGQQEAASNEAAAAIALGVPLEGLCIYPILNHPGWEDARHCYNGLFDYPNETGRREVYLPLATELAYQEHRVGALEALERDRTLVSDF